MPLQMMVNLLGLVVSQEAVLVIVIVLLVLAYRELDTVPLKFKSKTGVTFVYENVSIYF